MLSSQSLDESARRCVAEWAAGCAERVLSLFEDEAPHDHRPREAIERARVFARGELRAADEIRRRFVAGRAAHAVTSPAAIAAARSAAQASGVAHMGAHALGAAAYAAKARDLEAPGSFDVEISWQLASLTPHSRAALGRLPAVGSDAAGPLTAGGLLARGVLRDAIHLIQRDLA